MLSERCLSFTDTSFITMHLCTNRKPNLSNVVIFILIEQNESYVIRQNNVKRKMCVHYFLIKRKKLFGRPNTYTYIYFNIVFYYKFISQRQEIRSVLYLYVKNLRLFIYYDRRILAFVICTSLFSYVYYVLLINSRVITLRYRTWLHDSCISTRRNTLVSELGIRQLDRVSLFCNETNLPRSNKVYLQNPSTLSSTVGLLMLLQRTMVWQYCTPW